VAGTRNSLGCVLRRASVLVNDRVAGLVRDAHVPIPHARALRWARASHHPWYRTRPFLRVTHVGYLLGRLVEVEGRSAAQAGLRLRWRGPAATLGHVDVV